MPAHLRRLCSLCSFLCALSLLVNGCSSGSDGQSPVGVTYSVAPVVDLMVVAGNSVTVTLAWTSPVISENKAASSIAYDLRYTTLPGAGSAWEDWSVAAVPTPDTAGGIRRQWVVPGLDDGRTYVFGMKVSLDGVDWSEISNLTVGTAAINWDVTPPAAITDLRQWSGAPGTVTIAWSAAGDDSVYGRAVRYEVRRSETSFSSATWSEADVVNVVPVAIDEGARLTMTETGLPVGEVTHYAVRALDDKGHWSGLSNDAVVTADTMRTLRVKVDGTGDYPTIEEAIFNAQPGDVVLVGPGHYTWANQGTGDPLHGMINVPRDYADFLVVSEAGPEATILDAEEQGAVMSVTGGTRDIGGGELEYAGITIEGFTFTGGKADGEVGQGDRGWAGGGINIHLSDTVVRHCIFTGNTATEGGGIWSGGQGDTLFEDCVIGGNHANYGGGAMLVNSEPRITMRRCTIRGNTASFEGGGVFAYHVSMLIEDCVISGNRCSDEGGGLSLELLNPDQEIRGCTIIGNRAVFGSGVKIANHTNALITRTLLANNLEGPVFRTVAVAGLDMGCSLVFGNEGGDDLPQTYTDLGGNLFQDPLLCFQDGYSPGPDSPCLPANRSGSSCGLIGALEAGCED